VSGARGWIGGGGSPRVFVRLIRGRPPTDAEMNFGLRRDLSPEPRVLDGVGFSAGGAFTPNFRPSMARRLRMKPLPPIPGLPFSMTQKVAAEAAPKEEMDFSSVPPRFATAAASWVKIAFR